MATSLTNNTLTLNSQNYTAGTGGMLSIVPVGIQTFRNVASYATPVNWTLSSVSVGESKRWTSEAYRSSDNKVPDWSIKLPSPGTYISLCNLSANNVQGSSLTLGFISNASGGTTIINEGSLRYGGGYLSESPSFLDSTIYNRGEVAA